VAKRSRLKYSEPLTDIVIALALFLLAGLAVASMSWLLPAPWRLPSMIVFQALLALAVTGAIQAWRRRGWADIGLVAPGPRDLPRGMLAFAACLGANMLLVYVLIGAVPETVEDHTKNLGFIARQIAGGLPLPGLVALLILVGLYEEVFARGLLLDRCRTLFTGTWQPVLVSSVLFGLGHLYQGWLGVLQTTLIGVVLALFAIRWGSLWPVIIAHALLNISSIMLMESGAGDVLQR